MRKKELERVKEEVVRIEEEKEKLKVVINKGVVSKVKMRGNKTQVLFQRGIVGWFRTQSYWMREVRS